MAMQLGQSAVSSVRKNVGKVPPPPGGAKGGGLPGYFTRPIEQAECSGVHVAASGLKLPVWCSNCGHPVSGPAIRVFWSTGKPSDPEPLMECEMWVHNECPKEECGEFY